MNHVSTTDLRPEIEEAIERIVAEYDDVTFETNELLLIGNKDATPGEEGGIKVSLDGAPDHDLADVTQVADEVESALDEYDLDPARKRESESWGVGDEDPHPHVEVVTAALE